MLLCAFILFFTSFKANILNHVIFSYNDFRLKQNSKEVLGFY